MLTELFNSKHLHNETMLRYWQTTRGIWKVRSMFFYLSNRFTKPIMFDIILKSYLSFHYVIALHEDVIMQTRKILL